VGNKGLGFKKGERGYFKFEKEERK